MSDVTVRYELSDAHREQLFAFYFEQWWATKRTREQVEAALERSLVVVLTEAAEPSDGSGGRSPQPADGELIGFARIVTDRAIYAWIGDVMVRPDRRGSGLGARLLDAVLAHPDVPPAVKWELTCVPDMDDFYARWGFVDPSPSHMLRLRRD